MPNDDILANAKYGKQLQDAFGGEEIGIDSEQCLALAQQYRERAQQLTEQQELLRAVKSRAETEKEIYKGKWKPEGVFDTSVSAGTDKGHATAGTLSAAIESLNGAAGALTWLAENMDKTQQENVGKVDDVPAEELVTI